MPTLSVPITSQHEKFIEGFIREGGAETKAEVTRMALSRMERDIIVERILKSQREALAGKVFKGDLNELVKKFK